MDFKPDNIKTRCLNIKNMNEEFSRFQKLQNAIFSGRSMTSEINATNNTGFIEKLFPLIDEDLIIIAESPDNEPIGVLICLPDHYQLNFENRITRARLISIGVIKKWQKQGTGLAMIQHLTQNLIMKNYLQLEASYILQNNLPPQELLKKFHGKLIKTHVIYKKILI
ncbi:MAG: hypothetical protein JW982_04960 [Spirochaetes bacterium]|nr:hypothetical protein [Spirochaetota bacterium]